MSIHLLRELFQAAVNDKGLRCTEARMSYWPDRLHQRLEFDVVNGADNTARTIMSEPIPNGDSLSVATVKLAQTLS